MYEHNYLFKFITHVTLASFLFYTLQHSDVICDYLHIKWHGVWYDVSHSEHS